MARVPPGAADRGADSGYRQPLVEAAREKWRDGGRCGAGAMVKGRGNVVVVGAGLAGLTAAWRLQRLGYEVGVLERQERAGGRVGGEWIDGFCMDRWLQTLHSGDRRLLAWIDELGLRDGLLPLRPLQLAQVFRGVSTPIDPQRLMGVAAIEGVRWRDRPRLLRWARLMARYRPLLDPAAPERAAALDYRGIEDFTRLYFGPSVFERWVAPEVNASFGGDEHELSRVTALLTWVGRDTGRERSALHGLARHGLHEVAAIAAERLPIRFGVAVARVDERPAGGFALECRSVVGGRGVLEADAVVIATSAPEAGRIAANILAPAERDFFAQVRYGPCVTLAVALDRPPCGLPQLVRVPHAEGLPAESILLEPGIAGGRAPMGRGLATISANERFAKSNRSASDEVLEKGLLGCLEHVFPASAGSVRFTRLDRRSEAIPRFEVGAYRALDRFRRVEEDRRQLSRRLYFAGDHLIGPRAEDAVVSGLRAALDLDGDLRAAPVPVQS